MAWTVRSVSPTAALMSRIRASGSRAISRRTCPCPVRRVQVPPLWSGSVIPCDHILARRFSGVYTHEIFLAFPLTGVYLASILVVRSGHRSGPREVMQMRADSFPVELVRGVPVVTAPEEVDITNAAGLRAALAEAAGFGAAGFEGAGFEGAGFEGARHPAFVVDMTRTRFCDSAGIHALVEAHKRAQAAGGRVVLATSGVAVPRIFSLTGVDRVIPSFTSVAEALRHTPAGTGPLPLPDLSVV